MYKITILYGAIREGRLSIRAARAVQKALKDSGKTDVTFIDIKDYNLPVMEKRLMYLDNPPENLVTISNALKNADGIVFVSPEYNGSYSGAFKNAVDYFTKEWSKKPIGICAASGGRLGGVNASHKMQELILAINAFPMPYKLLVPHLADSLDEEGTPQDDILKKNLDKFVDEYLWFVEAIATQNKKKQ